jgi:hypothetical protein
MIRGNVECLQKNDNNLTSLIRLWQGLLHSRDVITINSIVERFEALTLHMNGYTMIRSVNFMMSLPSENLKNIECRIIKCYNNLITVIMIYCVRNHFPCKAMKKYKFLNYTFTWLW